MSKRKCRHRGVDRDGLTTICMFCGARGVLSLGLSNDSNPEHADEIHAAQWLAVAETRYSGLGVRTPYADGDGWIALDFDGDGWPWDPTRPLAGQYEERNASRILRRAMLAGDPATLAESMAERGCIDETIRADLGLVAVDLIVGEEPRDLITELCNMVREAGGTVRLYGQAVTADDLRRVAQEIVDDKLRQLKEHVAEQIERRAIAGATAARHAVRDADSDAEGP